jgi:hypothetical protein
MSFTKLKFELKKLLDENTRKDIVLLLTASPYDKEKMVKDSFELVIFLEKLKLVTENDVAPLLKLVRSANEPSLSSILHLLEEYQVQITIVVCKYCIDGNLEYIEYISDTLPLTFF